MMEAESEFVLTVTELCRVCKIDEDWLREFQSHGALESRVTHTAESLVRVRRARRLEQAFDLNMPALALVMDLLDEIERLNAGREVAHHEHR